MKYPRHLKKSAKLWGILEFKDVLIVGLVFFVSSLVFPKGHVPVLITSVSIGLIKSYDWFFAPGTLIYRANSLGRGRFLHWREKISDLSN